MIKYTSTHQVFIKIYIKNWYIKSKCFSKNRPVHTTPNFLNEEDLDVVMDEIRNDQHFQKSDTEIETYESKE